MANLNCPELLAQFENHRKNKSFEKNDQVNSDSRSDIAETDWNDYVLIADDEYLMRNKNDIRPKQNQRVIEKESPISVTTAEVSRSNNHSGKKTQTYKRLKEKPNKNEKFSDEEFIAPEYSSGLLRNALKSKKKSLILSEESSKYFISIYLRSNISESTGEYKKKRKKKKIEEGDSTALSGSTRPNPNHSEYRKQESEKNISFGGNVNTFKYPPIKKIHKNVDTEGTKPTLDMQSIKSVEKDGAKNLPHLSKISHNEKLNNINAYNNKLNHEKVRLPYCISNFCKNVEVPAMKNNKIGDSKDSNVSSDRIRDRQPESKVKARRDSLKQQQTYYYLALQFIQIYSPKLFARSISVQLPESSVTVPVNYYCSHYIRKVDNLL